MTMSAAVAVIAWCGLLTVLEMGGAVLAKQCNPVALAGGAVAFVLLYAAYVGSLRSASLTTITLGWIVVSALAAIALDAVLYGHRPDTRILAGALLILAGVGVMST